MHSKSSNRKPKDNEKKLKLKTGVTVESKLLLQIFTPQKLLMLGNNYSPVNIKHYWGVTVVGSNFQL